MNDLQSEKLLQTENTVVTTDEITKGYSKSDINEGSINEFQIDDQEKKGLADLLPTIIEIAVATSAAIEVVTKGVQAIDDKKQSLTKSAKTVHSWLHPIEGNSQTSSVKKLPTVAPPNTQEQKGSSSIDGSEAK